MLLIFFFYQRRDRWFTRDMFEEGAGSIRGFPMNARADDPFPLGLPRDHVFDPAELKAPAGRDIAITLTKEDESLEEFDGDALRAEMMVTARERLRLSSSPLPRADILSETNFTTDGTGCVPVVE
jgi:hypothetical protein